MDAHRVNHLLPLSLLILVTLLGGCRRVTLIGDSLLACGRDTIVDTINASRNGSQVYAEYLQGGCTAYNNPIHEEISLAGVTRAFGNPDVVVFSFAGNEMGRVVRGVIAFDYAVQSMQTLVQHAVEAGASCIVLLESSHRLRADTPINEEFERAMDRWFDHWRARIGPNTHGGRHYRILIADISGKIHADIDRYIGDYIHFNHAGARLAANAIVEQINRCP